jgi:iron(III) transport system permease protein
MSSAAVAASMPVVRARRHHHPDRAWIALSAAIAAALLAPLVLVVLDARSAGWTEIHRVLFRERSWFLLQHTVLLSLTVVALSGTIGVAAAWCTERSRVPFPRIWTVLLVLPVAVPDFVVGYAWHSIAPSMNGYFAAALVMTLGTYPLVYLPVAAAFRRADPAMEEAARSLGKGRAATFFQVTLPLIRTAVLGGCVLVVLTVISEYGAFEIVRFQTFTTEIFTEFKFDARAAGALAVPLVMLGLLVLLVDAIAARPAPARTTPRRARVRGRMRVKTVPVLLALVALVGLAIGVPVGTLVYWILQHNHSTLPAAATVGAATWTTVRYAALGALVSVVLSLPVAMMTFRRSSAGRVALERSTYVTQAVPGVVVALSLVFFATHYAYHLYQSSLLLVAAYAVLHFPLALVCVKTSVVQAPARLVDVGRSLGRGPVEVFVRVTLPLLAPGILAGFCLVFLTAVTELTATLVLAPIGVHTLATQFWAYESAASYSAAAPYALVIVAIATLPGALLGLWFDRESRSGVTGVL